MTLLPSAGGTVKAPPFIDVPAGAVVILVTWQIAQPIELNICAPALASLVAARALSRDGALVARMKRANLSMSARPSAPGWSSGSVVTLQTVVKSVGLSGLDIPISFTYASLANDNKLAIWAFHPKRPTRSLPPASSTGT